MHEAMFSGAIPAARLTSVRRDEELPRRAVLALYPDATAGRAQVEMHRAEALIRSGDVDGGAAHCVTVLTVLPAGWRQDALAATGFLAQRGRPAIRSVKPLGE
jgi:hypothetical protein